MYNMCFCLIKTILSVLINLIFSNFNFLVVPNDRKGCKYMICFCSTSDTTKSCVFKVVAKLIKQYIMIDLTLSNKTGHKSIDNTAYTFFAEKVSTFFGNLCQKECQKKIPSQNCEYPSLLLLPRVIVNLCTLRKIYYLDIVPGLGGYGTKAWGYGTRAQTEKCSVFLAKKGKNWKYFKIFATIKYAKKSFNLNFFDWTPKVPFFYSRFFTYSHFLNEFLCHEILLLNANSISNNWSKLQSEI